MNGWGDGQENTDRARLNKRLPYLHTDGQWQWYKGHQDILTWAVRRQKNAKELNKDGPNDITKNQPTDWLSLRYGWKDRRSMWRRTGNWGLLTGCAKLSAIGTYLSQKPYNIKIYESMNIKYKIVSFLGSGPKGPISCRTQGWISLCPSVRPYICPPPKASQSHWIT